MVYDDASQKKDKESKRDVKTSKKRNKERQALMVPRAICAKNHQIKNSGAAVSATPKKILSNVAVLNQRNCSLVADYGSDSDNGENKEEEKKTKVPSTKESKRKRLNSSEKRIKESEILPVNTAREKVHIKWIQSFKEKKSLHLPLEAETEKPQKKKIKKETQSLKPKKSEGLTELAKVLEDSPNQKKLAKKKTSKIKSKTLKKSHKSTETDDSNTTSSQIDSDSTKKKKIVKKKKKAVPAPVNKNNSCVLDGIDNRSSLVDSQLQTVNAYPSDLSESLKISLPSSPDVFGFKGKHLFCVNFLRTIVDV